jgi:NAD(P)H-flavin reductase
MNSFVCEIIQNTHINKEYFILQFAWEHHAPKAGQFFMLKPVRSCVFLPRPISVFEYNADSKVLKFLISKLGKGTEELYYMPPGERVILTGPLGNAWADFLPETGKAALVGGSAGVAPLAALTAEIPGYHFHFYAGFKNGFREKEEENAVLGSAANARKLIITAEDGRNAHYGLILDFLFEPASYDVIFGCGSPNMLNALKKKCESKNVPCFLSMENRFACGTGACLGCVIPTKKGNRRCCKEGPIFSSQEIIFHE